MNSLLAVGVLPACYYVTVSVSFSVSVYVSDIRLWFCHYLCLTLCLTVCLCRLCLVCMGTVPVLVRVLFSNVYGTVLMSTVRVLVIVQ